MKIAVRAGLALAAAAALVVSLSACSSGGASGGGNVLRVGATADLVLFSARFMTELLSRPQSDRVVLRAGRVLEATAPDWRDLAGVVGVAG